MGQFCEITLTLEFKENITPEEILNLITEIKTNDELQGEFIEDEDSLYLSSSRIQNLEYQLNDVLKPILDKHKNIIEEVNGSILIESGESFFYGHEE